MADLSKRETIDVVSLLKTIALEKFPDRDWSGLDEATMTGLLAQLVGELSDQTNFVYDFRTKQAYIKDAKLERDARSVALNLGSIPEYRSSAVCTVQLSNSDTIDVIAPKGTEVQGKEGIKFSSISQVTIPTAGNNTVDFIEGEFKVLEQNAVGDEFEEVTLTFDNVVNIDDSRYFKVLVNGIEYTYKETFKDSLDTDLHFYVRYNANNYPVITFGNNVTSRRLNPSDNVLVEFFIGGGTLGNSVVTLDTLTSTFTGSSKVTVVNTTSPSGGKNNPSLVTIQTNLPGFVTSASGITNTNNVQGNLRKQFSYVQSARAKSTYDETTKKPTAIVYVLPVSNTVIDLTVQQKQEIDDFLSSNALIGTSWQSANVVEQPTTLEIDVLVANKNDLEIKEKQIRDYLFDVDTGIWRAETRSLTRLPTIKEFTDIALTTISAINGISRIDVIGLNKKPTLEALGNGDTSDIEVIELNKEVEEGEYIFTNTSNTASTVNFYKPFNANQITELFVKDDSKDFTLDTDAFVLNELTTGLATDFIKIDTGKIKVKSSHKVWKINQFADATDWTKQSILKVTYQDDSPVLPASPILKTLYFNIESNTQDEIVCTNATSLNGTTFTWTGDELLNDNLVDTFSNVSYKIYRGFSGRDLTFDYKEDTNSWKFTTSVTYNDHNTLYVTGVNLIEQLSINNTFYIEFVDAAIPNIASSRFWISNNLGVEAKTVATNYSNTDGVLKLRTSSLDSIKFKDFKEVLTLTSDNTKINIKTF